MTIACRENNAPTFALHCTSTFASFTTISAVPFACYYLTCRPMTSDDESSWHSGMAILEQRSTSRSAGSSARISEVPATDIPQQKTTKSKLKKKHKSNKTRTKTKKTKKRTKRQNKTYHSSSCSGSFSDSAYINHNHHLQLYHHHTNDPTNQAASTSTSAPTGEAPRPRACAKMLVRAGSRCPCHFLRECPSVIFQQPVTLVFHPTTNWVQCSEHSYIQNSS